MIYSSSIFGECSKADRFVILTPYLIRGKDLLTLNEIFPYATAWPPKALQNDNTTGKTIRKKAVGGLPSRPAPTASENEVQTAPAQAKLPKKLASVLNNILATNQRLNGNFGIGEKQFFVESRINGSGLSQPERADLLQYIKAHSSVLNQTSVPETDTVEEATSTPTAGSSSETYFPESNENQRPRFVFNIDPQTGRPTLIPTSPTIEPQT